MFDYVNVKFLTFLSIMRDRRAVTAMEYGLIAALIAVVIVTTLGTIGTNLNTKFQTIATKLQ